MTPTQLKEAAQVMALAAEGKQVQFRYNEKCEWEDSSEPGWNWHIKTYRIKPEPREWWLDPRTGMVLWEFEMKEGVRGNLIKVREVIE